MKQMTEKEFEKWMTELRPDHWTYRRLDGQLIGEVYRKYTGPWAESEKILIKEK